MGAVISASHNPFHDNGIKFFDARGRKLSDEAEAAIEAHVHAGGARAPGADADDVRPGARADRSGRRLPARARDAASSCRSTGKRVLLDCANGATYRAAPLLFERLGAEVECIACEPDGVNINAGCGSTHLELISERIRAGGHDVGFAFDGDGDRVLAVAPDGSVVDGDEIIAAIGQDLKRRGELHGQRRRRHRDDELRIPPDDGRGRHRGRDHRRRRPARGRGALPPRLGAGRRAVRPHRRHAAHARPATASPRRCSCCARSATSRWWPATRCASCRRCS